MRVVVHGIVRRIAVVAEIEGVDGAVEVAGKYSVISYISALCSGSIAPERFQGNWRRETRLLTHAPIVLLAPEESVQEQDWSIARSRILSALV
jgi:hypothetical protein